MTSSRPAAGMLQSHTDIRRNLPVSSMGASAAWAGLHANGSGRRDHQSGLAIWAHFLLPLETIVLLAGPLACSLAQTQRLGGLRSGEVGRSAKPTLPATAR